MQLNQFPPGWDEKKIRELIAYHDQSIEGKVVAEFETDRNSKGWRQSQKKLSLPEIVADIHLLHGELETFEQLYGILSATFYEAYLRGEEPENEDWALDWAEWATTYQTWLRRQAEYQYAFQSLRTQATSLTQIIQQSAERLSAPLSVGT